jgi:HK97 family phage portal protein
MKWPPWKSSKRTEKKSAITSIPISPGSFLGYALTGGGSVNAQQAATWYRTNSAVATAVDIIAESFEQISPVLEITDRNGNKTFEDDGEVIQLLKKPNGFQTWQEFAGGISRHYLLNHDSHIAGLGNINREPIEIYAVKPQNVSVTEDFTDSFPASYIVPQGAGRGTYNRETAKNREMRFYDGPLKELYHIMGFSSRSNNIQGDSPLEAAALETKQQIEGRIHNLQMLKRGGRLSLIVSLKDEEEPTPGDDDEHKERAQRINEQLSGADNAGKIAVVSAGDMDITEVGKSNKDMDYAKLDETASQAIYNRYRIPLPIISLKASTFNNMQTAIEFLYDFAVLPHADIIFAGASKFLLPRYGIDTETARITYNPDSITALMSRRLDQLEKRRKMNIETINELRAGLPNKGDIEGGDNLYQPVNLVPLGSEVFEDVEPDEEAQKLLERDGLI